MYLHLKKGTQKNRYQGHKEREKIKRMKGIQTLTYNDNDIQLTKYCSNIQLTAYDSDT